MSWKFKYVPLKKEQKKAIVDKSTLSIIEGHGIEIHGGSFATLKDWQDFVRELVKTTPIDKIDGLNADDLK